MSKAPVLAALAAVLLLAGCTGAEGGAPEPAAPGSSHATPGAQSAQPAEIGTEAPAGGAAVRLGDYEEAIGSVGCTNVNENWSMSGSVDDGAKVAVLTNAARDQVLSASVVLADGKLVQMEGGNGEAAITWDGGWFTVEGSGPYYDLMDPEVAGQDSIGFMVRANCPE